MMLEELQRRHYSEATTQRYIRFIERFAQHFHCSPDRLGPRHIREYQAQLFTVHKLTPGTVTNHLCALRFFYIQTLKRPWSIADTPYPKKRYRLPTILSQEEVTQLIDAAPTSFYRTILMTLYGTGVRRTELTRLKVSDIDSRRMVVHMQDGKGHQDRGSRRKVVFEEGPAAVGVVGTVNRRFKELWENRSLVFPQLRQFPQRFRPPNFPLPCWRNRQTKKAPQVSAWGMDLVPQPKLIKELSDGYR